MVPRLCNNVPYFIHCMFYIRYTYHTQRTTYDVIAATGIFQAKGLLENNFKTNSRLMSIIRYQPPQTLAFSGFDRLSNLRDELDTLFEMPFWSNFGRQSQLFSGWSPALDLYQNNDNVIARVELPGMRKEDIEISLHDGMLTINGERKSETAEGDKAERTERYVGKFRRSISLPTQVDANKVTANYRDGILTVTLPKAEEAKPKQIKVDVA